MAFSRWLRENSEHYLMADAQRRMAEKYGRPAPPGPHGWRERFWLGVFAPTYRLLPWKARRLTIQMMPGSHRQTWARPATRGIPAVGGTGPAPSPSRPAEPQPATTNTVPETGGD